MKKNRRNNSRPAAIATAKDTTKAIETRAGVLKEAEDVKKEAKTSFYLQYMGKEISTEEITKKVHEVWTLSLIHIFQAGSVTVSGQSSTDRSR